MEFSSPLVRGRLLQRYKRFFVDVALDDGTFVTAHVPNPGAMLGLKDPGSAVWLSRSDDPKRKLAYTLEMVEAPDGLVGVNTMHPNHLATEAITAGAIPELAGYASLRREVAYDSDSRIDILLQDEDRAPCWVEVKNCHFLRRPGLAEFPDCVTTRATKHLGALGRRVAQRERAVVLFVVQREDCDAFAACHDLDPTFAKGLEDAADLGVEVLAYACAMGSTSIHIARPIPWVRNPQLLSERAK
jgi:sugar fermentation stimulation protein A